MCEMAGWERPAGFQYGLPTNIHSRQPAGPNQFATCRECGFISTLLALSEKHPDAVVTVREEFSEAIVDAIGRGEIDVIVDVLPFDESHLNVEQLFSDEFHVAVHQDNPLTKMDAIRIDALDGMPFILLEDIHCLARQIEEYCFNRHFVPKVMFQASQLATVKELIEKQYGISILPRICIDNESDSKIRYLKLEGAAPKRDVVLATSKDRYISPAAQYFVSVIKAQYQTA